MSVLAALWRDGSLLAAWVFGVGNGLHCVLMCGGVALALSASPCVGGSGGWVRLFWLNAGRLLSYLVLGAVAGALGQSLLHLAPQWLAVQRVLLGLSLLVFGLMALHLLGWRAPLRQLERVGRWWWPHLAPVWGRWLRQPSAGRSLGAGLLWGLLPCGLVYAMLINALSQASAWGGAGLLFAFGLGTLPNVSLLLLLPAAWRQKWQASIWARGLGLLVLVWLAWRMLPFLT